MPGCLNFVSNFVRCSLLDFLMRVNAVHIGSLWGAQSSLVLSPAGWQSLSRWWVLFQDMVEACSFQPILGQVLEAFVQWMVWHSVHTVCEKLSVPSRVNGLHSSCFLHGSYGCALHCAKCGSETHVLYLVEFVRVGLGFCSPRTCSLFKRWSHCPSVHCL